MATLGPDPTPIPESFRWDGSSTSVTRLLDWANRTRQHYELPDQIKAARHPNGNVILYSEGHQNVRTLTQLIPGQEVTFTPRHGFGPKTGLGSDIPRDHPPTVRELSAVLDARLEREAGISAAMARHPSGKRRGPTGP